MTFLVVGSVLLVNLFYPEWTGGWSTGPRLLLPLIPFAMLPVAALLAGRSRWARVATFVALVLALAGGLGDASLSRGRTGGFRPDFEDPLVQTVWPLWTGQAPLPGWRFGERFCRNLVSLVAPDWIAGLAPRGQAIQFLPLIVAQVFAILGLWRYGSSDANDRESSCPYGLEQKRGDRSRADEKRRKGNGPDPTKNRLPALTPWTRRLPRPLHEMLAGTNVSARMTGSVESISARI